MLTLKIEINKTNFIITNCNNRDLWWVRANTRSLSCHDCILQAVRQHPMHQVKYLYVDETLIK